MKGIRFMQVKYTLNSLGKDYIPDTQYAIYFNKYLSKINIIKKRNPDWEKTILPEPNEDEEHSKNHFVKIKILATGEISYVYCNFVKHSKNEIITELKQSEYLFTGKQDHKYTDKEIEEARYRLDGWYDDSGMMLNKDIILDVLDLG